MGKNKIISSVYIYRQIDRSSQAGDVVNRCVIGTNKPYRDSFICCLNDFTIPTKIHHRINYWLIYTTCIKCILWVIKLNQLEWIEKKALTPNTPLIQLWCAQSKLNMDEIFSLNIHVWCLDIPQKVLLKSLHARKRQFLLL